jgi:hypothetical protein
LPFLASFLTSLVSFFPPFLGSPAAGANILLAASNLACLSLSTFARSSFLNSSFP